MIAKNNKKLMLYSKQNNLQKAKAKSSLTGYTRFSVRKEIQKRMLCDEKVQTGFSNKEEIVLTGFSCHHKCLIYDPVQISQTWCKYFMMHLDLLHLAGCLNSEPGSRRIMQTG